MTYILYKVHRNEITNYRNYTESKITKGHHKSDALLHTNTDLKNLIPDIKTPQMPFKLRFIFF